MALIYGERNWQALNDNRHACWRTSLNGSREMHSDPEDGRPKDWNRWYENGRLIKAWPPTESFSGAIFRDCIWTGPGPIESIGADSIVCSGVPCWQQLWRRLLGKRIGLKIKRGAKVAPEACAADSEDDAALKLVSVEAAERVRVHTIRSAASIARNGCLVPPDGGSPTETEAEMCVRIADTILQLI